MIENFDTFCPNEHKFIPDRVCGDIPFHQYRSIFAKPSKYIEFIKQLEQSTSRHDFIFWFFDIIAGGREEQIHYISVKEIDDEVKNTYRNVSDILKHTSGNAVMSDYIIQEYPMIFKIPFEKICHNPVLFTVRNNDEIFRYRQNALSNIRIKMLENINDEFIHLNPMKGLSLYDLPEAHTELGYEKPDERKSATQPFFTFYHHFIGLFTYSKQIPDTTDCILVDKDPYKRLQIETYMKAISIDKLVKVHAANVQELGLNNSTVVIIERQKFLDDDGQQSFYKPKRARVLCNILQPSSTEIWALFLDYGEISAVSVSNIYTYEFKKDAPKFLSEIVPENKLSKAPQEGEIFVFDLEKMKYVCVGRKSCNFNPEANPLDEVDTDTESVYFGPDATDDWENEEDFDGDDNIIDFKDVISENNRISLILKENGLNLVNEQKESGIDDKNGADIFSSDDDSSDSE